MEEELVERDGSRKSSVCISRRFLIRQFGGRDNKLAKMAEIKIVEQEERMIKEFFQEFKRVARENGYEERTLVEEFKRGIN